MILRPISVLSALLLAAPVFAHAATIVHSNDVLGELEPCGCRNNPQGGVARKATLLKRQGDAKLIQLDAGDLLFPTTPVPAPLARQSELQAGYLLKALDGFGHDAVVPGEKDFGLGVKTLRSLVKKSKIKFLAANLRDAAGKKLFQDHAIFVRKENGRAIRVAVFGIVGKDLEWPPELQISSPIEAARAQVNALRGKADVIVALTHQGYEKDVELARKVAGIDYIIGGHTQSFLQKPIQENGTWIFQSSFRNQYVGLIPAVRAGDFKPETYQLIGLDAGYDSPADAPSASDRLVKQFKTELAELNRRETVSETPSGAVAYQTFPRCGECHAKQLDFWRRTQHAKAFQTLHEKQSGLNKECLGCHTVGLNEPNGYSDINRIAETNAGEKSEILSHDEMNSFLKLLHGASSLKDRVKLRPKDAEAVPLRQALSQFQRAWATVQCENCHGPGGEHPFSEGLKKTVQTKTCLGCHTQDKAPGWYSKDGKLDEEKVAAKRKQISCPAGELPPEE